MKHNVTQHCNDIKYLRNMHLNKPFVILLGRMFQVDVARTVEQVCRNAVDVTLF